MGCWSETCQLTRAPIDCGEDVVMLVPALDLPSSDHVDRLSLAAELLVLERGAYDDYGWLTNVERPEAEQRLYLRSLFFLGRAWDRVLADHGPTTESWSLPSARLCAVDSRVKGFLFKQLGVVLRFMTQARLQLGPASYKGMQGCHPLAYATFVALTTAEAERMCRCRPEGP